MTITLHTYGTPHGHRASIMLEECGLPYRVNRLQFEAGRIVSPRFEAISPLCKFPAMTVEDGAERHIFGSGAILWYLAERAGLYLPTEGQARQDCQCWLMLVLTDFAPVTIGHFRFAVLAPERLDYAVGVYEQEIERNLKALDRRLAVADYLAGAEYSIADIAAWPFVDAITQGAESGLDPLPHLRRWHRQVGARPAVLRGMQVPNGPAPLHP